MTRRRPAAVRPYLLRATRHPLTWVVLAATAIRVVVVAGVSVSLGYADSARYVGQASGTNVAADGVAPPGYALFLRVAHALTDSVDAVLVAQQCLVIAAGICVYAAARSLGTTRGVAAGAAAVMMLCGNLLATSQAVLTETLFTTLGAVGALLLVRQVMAPSLRTALLLGGALGAAITVRSVALPVAVLSLLLLVLLVDRSRRGVLAGAAALGSAALVVAVVAVAMSTTSGLPLVGSSAQGWVLYGRVAPFANCQELDPPGDLRSLCPTGAPGLRPGPDYYRFVGGPAVARFHYLPQGDSELNAFATRAIVAQPLAYAKAVTIDGVRFFAPSFGTERPYNGAGWDELELDRALDPASAARNKEVIETWFAPYAPRTSTLRLAARYQEATTLTGGHLLVLLLLSVAAVAWAGGRERRAAWILLAGGTGMLLAAVAINMYVARYALPSLGFLLPAAALGLTALAGRITASSPPPQEPTAPTPERQLAPVA